MNQIIQSLIQDVVSKGISDQVSSKLGISSDQANSAISMLLPVLMGGLQNNAQDTQEAQNIAKTLEKKHADGNIFNHLDALIKRPESEKGEKIAQHILKGNKTAVEKKIAQKSGIDQSAASSLLSIVAPLLMGKIGQSLTGSTQTQNKESILSNILNGGNSQENTEQSFFTSFLDKDGDGEIMDDVFNIGMNFLKK